VVIFFLSVQSDEPVDLWSFGPISSEYEKINPQNISYMPVVILLIFLNLERKSS